MEETLMETPTPPSSPDLPPADPQAEGEQIPPQEPKKTRGRPRKNQQIPEADVIPRKVKEPKVGKNAEKSTSQTAEFFAQQIFGMHTLASLITGMDLTIDPKGAASMGQAIYEVVKEYDLSWLNKFTPVMNLIVTTAIVEGPVILKARAQSQAKKAQKKEAQILKNPSPLEGGEPLKVQPAAGGLGQAQPGFNPTVLQGGGPLGSVNIG